jgi:hypothetical protein
MGRERIMPKCDNCLNFKHRYMLLTGMHYPEIQEALNTQKIKALQFTCEGMGCQYYAQGTDIDPDTRNIEWNCPHFKEKTLKNATSKARMNIDSHANINEYPKTVNIGEPK